MELVGFVTVSLRKSIVGLLIVPRDGRPSYEGLTRSRSLAAAFRQFQGESVNCVDRGLYAKPVPSQNDGMGCRSQLALPLA